MSRPKPKLGPLPALDVTGLTVEEQIRAEATWLIEASWREGCDRAHVEAALRRMYERGKEKP